MADAGHKSCMVHTTGLPVLNIFLMFERESMPWFIHERWMTSASLNSLSDVISVPELAMSKAKRYFREKRNLKKTQKRSHRKCHLVPKPFRKLTTVMSSVSLSRTSIFAFIPLWLSASFKRLAATAAPPVFSLVLTISTRIVLQR